MKSTKCAECGFVGWADLENCKACGAPLVQHSHNLPRATSLPMTDYVQWDEAEPPKQGLAICALVLGILSCASCGVFAITSLPGTIISWIAMQRAKREPWRYGGQGLATAGFILNVIMLIFCIPVTAAIVIPNLLAARRAANEASARNTMSQISSAEVTYQSVIGKFGTLKELAAQNLIDKNLANGFKNGYIFSIELTTDEENQEGYAITAVPMNYGTSGARSFYIDETQVMRAADNRGGPASKLDEPVDPGYDYRSTERPRRADYRPQTVY